MTLHRSDQGHESLMIAPDRRSYAVVTDALIEVASMYGRGAANRDRRLKGEDPGSLWSHPDRNALDAWYGSTGENS
ncbi:MAG: hypothetical protein OEM39_09975 [Acidimicrobiia bacterium]|nr:hypothetical protein [Acidimicrobiia bacterium]